MAIWLFMTSCKLHRPPGPNLEFRISNLESFIPLRADSASGRHNDGIGAGVSRQRVGAGRHGVPVRKETQGTPGRRSDADAARELPNGIPIALAACGIRPIEFSVNRVDLHRKRCVGCNGLHSSPLKRGFQNPCAAQERPLVLQPGNVRYSGGQQDRCAGQYNYEFRQTVAAGSGGAPFGAIAHTCLTAQRDFERKNYR